MSTLDTYRQLAPDHPVWQQFTTDRHPGQIPPEESSHPGEEGSLITEYGLLAIVAATVAAAVISWASEGAMASLFDSLLQQARGLVGG